ncbi:MAG: YIP1 family protein [Oscillospiraceae bacterium]|nr:YIP1 family protein [Oscillospiraceae bacterium]
MKQALYILRHPIYGVWDMKREKTGRYRDGFILILLAIIAVTFNRQMRAFVFNYYYNVPLDILKQVALVVLPVVLFSLANWSITTLAEGKGSFKDIFMVTCYALMPLIIFQFITPILTHFITLNEQAYLNIIDGVGFGWTFLMLILGIQEIHEYSAGKMVSTTVLTVIAMAIIVFIVLLFFSLLQELGSFVYSLYREFSLRL